MKGAGPAIECDAVARRFGDRVALHRLDLAVERGEILGLLGPNGSGKTTTLRILATLLQPHEGAARVLQWDVVRDAMEVRRRIGVMPERPSLYERQTVEANVSFWAEAHGLADPAGAVGEALRFVGLEDRRREPVGSLSKGLKQRVALARAIVFKPDILLLDEPLAALDRNLREAVRGEIRALQHRLGITTVMVTHDQDEAMSLSDEIVLMAEGRIEQVGSPETLYHRPATRFAAGFLGSASVLEGRLEGAAIVTGSGERFPAAAAGRPEGATVTGILRPEAVSIAPGAGAVTGRVIDVDFLGEVIRYAVRTPAGQILRAHVSGLHQRLGLGETVHLGWDPARVWLLPDPAGTDPGQPGRDRDLSMDRNFSETERISR